MPPSRQNKRSVRIAIIPAAIAAALWLPTAATASTNASSPSRAASAPVPYCSLQQLSATQDHIGRVAEVTSINEMDTVTVTISNDGPECGSLGAILSLQAATNETAIAWPQIYWSLNGNPWTASPTSTSACRQPGPPVCLTTSIPQQTPLPSGQTTLALALDFTSWNDALYSFSGAISLNDYDDSANGDFGLNSTNDWLLNCPNCTVDGSTVLPPGSGGNTQPTAAPGAGSPSHRPTSATPSPNATRSTNPTPTGTGPTASTAPTTTATPTAFAATTPRPHSPKPALLTPAASNTNDSTSTIVVGTGIATTLALAGGALVLTRRRRRTDDPPA